MLNVLGKLLFGAIDGAFAVAEAVSNTFDRAKRLFKKAPAPDETPVPLTHRSVEHQQQQIREATTRRDAIRPPPR